MTTGQFIYVFSRQDRDTLLRAGFLMLREDEPNCVFVFKTDDRLSYALTEMSYIRSDSMSFSGT